MRNRKVEPICGIQSPDPHHAKAIEIDGELLCCGGIHEMGPGVGSAWFMMTHHAKKHKQQIVELVVGELYKALNHYHRIQCLVLKDFVEGQKFVEWLGFRKEGELKKFTPNKQNVYLYAIVES